MIISSFYPIIGGAERIAYEIGRIMVLHGFKVLVLTRQYGHNIPRKEEIDGINIYRITSSPGKVGALLFILLSIIYLFRHHKDYDVIHCHTTFSPAIIGVIANMLLNKRVIVTVHSGGSGGNIDSSKRLPLIGNLKFLLFRKYVDVFISVNQQVTEELKSIGIRECNIHTLYNAVDIIRICPVSRQERERIRAEYGWTGKIVGIFVGRLDKVKNLDNFLRAAAKSIKQYKQLHVVFIGDGPERESLVKLSMLLGISENTSFLGKQNDVVPYLRGADFFVLPSFREGISMALLEAMACGLPAIVTPIGGNLEVIKHKINGIFVPIQDPDKLSEKINLLVSDNTTRLKLGINARKTIEQNFNLYELVDHHIELYRNVP